VSKKRVEAEVVSEEWEAAPEGRTTLVQAVPKGKLFEWILEKATELGAARIVPLLTERTVVQLDGAERERKREKWQRAVVEACKQCGQNWLPVVDEPVSLPVFLRTPAASDAWVASLHPGAVPVREAFSGRLAGDVSVFVGPEGDFTGQEMERVVGWGARPVSLGRIVLRVETAAMYCLSVLSSLRQ
jgi:16S rRNA (uracil1498-N3)-methyltransferase